MMNYVIWRLIGPETWPLWTALLAVVLVLLGKRGRWLRIPVLLGAAASAVMMFTPLGIWLLRPLEDRYPVPRLAAVPVRDIIVLTGPEDPTAAARSGRLEVGPAAERVFEGAALKRQFPRARLWVAGGNRDARYPWYDWQWTQSMWTRLGVASHGIGGTHDTYQNAQGAVAAGITGRPLLVTSGWHMPRAVASFRAAGLDPIPYPVDFQSGPSYRTGDGWNLELARNLNRADTAIHEWLGLIYYRVSGRTKALMG